MKQRVGSMRKSTRLTNPYPKIKRQRENIQINKIKNEKGDITTDTEEIQRIIRFYYKSLYAKIGKSKIIGHFLDKQNIPKLSQDQVNN